MTWSDDPEKDFERYDAEQQKDLDRLPVCCCCEEPIQQEKAIYYNDQWCCEIGQIRSIPRQRTHGGILKQYEDRYGYMKAVLYKDKKPHYFTVHRLVALAFVDNPSGKYIVDHIDCNRKNNYFENLRWVTTEENLKYSHELGRQRCNSKPLIAISSKGEKIRFESQREAARNLKICQSSIGRCLNGEFKQAKGWCFEWLR